MILLLLHPAHLSDPHSKTSLHHSGFSPALSPLAGLVGSGGPMSPPVMN